MLEVSDLRLAYGRALAIDGVDLSVKEGEAVSLIGPNGAGKTSLLLGLSGLRPYDGNVRFRGEPIRGLSPDAIVRRGLVHCPQAAQLFGEMSVIENLELGAYLVRQTAIQRRNALDRVFALFPRLQERGRQRAATLSGGERQMVAIGRALMSDPKLLMLDEPSLGLAPILRDQIEDALLKLRQDWALTVLLVEQDTGMALSFGTRVYIMDAGKLVRMGPPELITSDPALREAYLGVS